MTSTFDSTDSNPTRQVFSVSELNRRARTLLEMHLPLLWVEGEISNLSTPSSGHWYFTLKDPQAQVRCAMFRNRNALTAFKPKAGDKVIVRAKTSIYEGRGDYQLIVEHMEDAGFGILQRRYQELKRKLEQEGLFASEPKKPLPAWPKQVAVITSPSGAAVRDVLAVLKRRFPALPVSILPVAVQGESAAQEIIEAIDLAHKLGRFDLILLCRGGGSIEDLWAFNSEKLARRIYRSRIPVVSAVGHEIDFTIADFVADVRAPTPSAAAELISPNQQEFLQRIKAAQKSLHNAINSALTLANRQLRHNQRLLRHPGERLQAWGQRLDQLEIRLLNAWQGRYQHAHSELMHIKQRIAALPPSKEIERKTEYLAELQQRLSSETRRTLELKKQRFVTSMEMLDLVSPLKILERGYSITRNEQGEVIRSVQQVGDKERLSIRLHDGTLAVINHTSDSN